MIGPPRIVPKMPGSWRATAVLCVTAVGGYRALRCSTALPTLGRDAVLPFGGDSIAHLSRGTYKMHAVDAPADSPMRRKPPRRCRKGVDVVFSTLNVSLRPRVAADNQPCDLVSPAYRGLTPEDLIDIAVLHGLHYDATTQEGVM